MASPKPARARTELTPAGDRALEHEKPARARDQALCLAECALEQVRGTGEREVARIADRQHRLAHRTQLLVAGVGRGAIAHRLQTGRLHAVYRDVYLIGDPPLGPLAVASAAVLHHHPFAVVSHRTAAALWGMLDDDEVSATEPVDVTLIGRSAHSRPGLRLHRVNQLGGADVRRHRDLPVTSPPRTLIDNAAAMSPLELENALARTRRQGLARETQIRTAMQRMPARAPGLRKLAALIDGTQTPALTRSRAERHLLALLRSAGLPVPLANQVVLGHEVDLLWPAQRLIVEFDGWETHQTREAFETDRLRDQRLSAAGYRVLRITYRQVYDGPNGVIARIAAALALCASS